MEDEEHLTAFERERAARIRSNFERLKQLGVVDAVQQIRPKHVKPVKGQQQQKEPKLKPWEKELPSTARRSSRLIGLKTQGPKISKTQGAQVHGSNLPEDSVLTRKASLVVYRKKVLELPRDLLGKLKYSSLEVKEKPSQQVCPTEDKSQSGRLRKPTSPAIKLQRYMADQDQRPRLEDVSELSQLGFTGEEPDNKEHQHNFERLKDMNEHKMRGRIWKITKKAKLESLILILHQTQSDDLRAEAVKALRSLNGEAV